MKLDFTFPFKTDKCICPSDKGVGSNGFILSEMHQIRKLLDSAHGGWEAVEVNIPLMKMKCAQNSPDFAGGEGGGGKGDCRSERAT